MKIFSTLKLRINFLVSSIFILFLLSGCLTMNPHSIRENEDNDKYDGPDKAAQFEFERTKDPATGKVPREKYLLALQQTITSKDAASHAPTPVRAAEGQRRRRACTDRGGADLPHPCS